MTPERRKTLARAKALLDVADASLTEAVALYKKAAYGEQGYLEALAPAKTSGRDLAETALCATGLTLFADQLEQLMKDAEPLTGMSGALAGLVGGMPNADGSKHKPDSKAERMAGKGIEAQILLTLLGAIYGNGEGKVTAIIRFNEPVEDVANAVMILTADHLPTVARLLAAAVDGRAHEADLEIIEGEDDEAPATTH